MATMIGTSAAREWLIASTVCGMMPSSAATTRTTMSVTLAPRARMAVKASWPGVSRKVTLRPCTSTVWAPMCCVMPPASPAATSVERIEQRRLPGVDVSHHGDDRRARHRVALPGLLVGFEGLLDVEGDVLDLVLELAGQEHGRVVVEHLVDGRHHPHVDQLLQDLAGLDAHGLREVADGDHLGDADHALRRARPRDLGLLRLLA